MIEDRILFSGWGSNGGVDAVVKSLRTKLETRNIGSDFIQYDPNSRVVGFSEENNNPTWYNFEDFVNKINWAKYVVIDLHSCNFHKEDLKKIRIIAEHIPIIYHVHGLIAHYGRLEAEESQDTSMIDVMNWLNSRPIETREKEIKKYFKDWQACKLQEMLLEEADKLIYLTNFTYKASQEWYPECSKGNKREVIIPNGSDFHIYSEDSRVKEEARNIRSKFGGNNAKIIIYSGRITVPKGAADLAKAFDKIKEKYGEATLLMVGDAYEGKDLVYDNIRPEYRDSVIFTGWLKDKEDLAAHLKAADVLAIPSHHETFSIAALEGMFMGTPVIMGDVDGSHEVYVEPQLAYGTKPGDTNRMVDLFNYLFENKERATKNASHVRMVVNEKYNLDKVTDMNLGLYSQAVLSRYSNLMNFYISNNRKQDAKRIYDLMSKNLPFNPQIVMR